MDIKIQSKNSEAIKGLIVKNKEENSPKSFECSVNGQQYQIQLKKTFFGSTRVTLSKKISDAPNTQKKPLEKFFASKFSFFKFKKGKDSNKTSFKFKKGKDFDKNFLNAINAIEIQGENSTQTQQLTKDEKADKLKKMNNREKVDLLRSWERDTLGNTPQTQWQEIGLCLGSLDKNGLLPIENEAKDNQELLFGILRDAEKDTVPDTELSKVTPRSIVYNEACKNTSIAPKLFRLQMIIDFAKEAKTEEAKTEEINKKYELQNQFLEIYNLEKALETKPENDPSRLSAEESLKNGLESINEQEYEQWKERQEALMLVNAYPEELERMINSLQPNANGVTPEEKIKNKAKLKAVLENLDDSSLLKDDSSSLKNKINEAFNTANL